MILILKALFRRQFAEGSEIHMAKRYISRALLIVLSVGLVMAAIAANGIDAYATEKKPTFSTKYKVITIGSKISTSLDTGNWYIKSIKVTSSDEGVVTAKKENLYSVVLKGKKEGTATVKAKVKAYRYKGSKKSKTKTFNLKCKVEVMDSSGFLQYVYTDEKGRKCFKYTGTDDTCIVVPEGVEKITSFTDVDSLIDFNTTITKVVLPSTLRTMSMYCIFDKTDNDHNWYSCLYQCTNLQSVIGESIINGDKDYIGTGPTVIRAHGNICEWSNSERIPYDESQYILHK